MTYTCDFCGTEFNKKNNLIGHLKTALYCLDIQKKKGLNIDIISHKCKCEKIFSTKTNLNKHMKICKISQSANINSDTTNTKINNDLPDTMKNDIDTVFTISDINPESIGSVLKPVITKKSLSEGITVVINIIINVLLQRNNKYCYYCTDRSRKIFKMLVRQGEKIVEQVDANVIYVRALIIQPLFEILHDIEKTQNKNEDIYNEEIYKITCQEIINLKNDAKLFKNILSNILPASYEGIYQGIKIQENFTNIEEKWKDDDFKQIYTINTTIKKNTGKIIPKALREQVWLHYIGQKFESKCLVEWCNNIINVFNFEVGHNQPKSLGGLTTMNNLMTICSRCNKSMNNNYSIDEWNKIIQNENNEKE